MISSRAELRIQILRGILPISCPQCPIMNTIYHLDLQKQLYDANINSYQHALLCVRHHAKHFIMYISPFDMRLVQPIILPPFTHMNPGTEALMNLSQARANKQQ